MPDDSATITATEVEQIEEALHRLLTAATHTFNVKLRGPDRGPVSAGTLSAEYMESLSWSEARRDAAELFQDPVGEALRQAVTTLGERLHELGVDMIDVCYRIAERDPSQHDRRLSIMDHRWSGIGDWMA
jgi:hypothetical protein